MKRAVNFYELLWTMLLYLLITNFGWVLLIIVILTCPIWIAIADRARATKRANEQFEKILKENED